jgi:hypothetical protein
LNGDAQTVALLGLPRTGKSTYLGALWQLIQDPGDDTVTEVDVAGDRSYLQFLGEQVAKAEEIERTEFESEEGLRLTVDFRGIAHLSIPDMSGELLRQLIEDRYWHEHLLAVARDARAVLVFVHPARLRLPISINAAKQLAGGSLATGKSSTSTKAPPPPEFSPDGACTAAKHLDGLENVLEVTRGGGPVRVGLVVSAWDLADGEPTPSEWIAEHLPALGHMLAHHEDVIETTVFGVSAQGGPLPSEQEALLARGDVRDRAYALDSDGSSVALAEPLRWAIFG